MYKLKDCAKAAIALLVVYGSIATPLVLSLGLIYKYHNTDYATLAIIGCGVAFIPFQYAALYFAHVAGKWFINNWGNGYVSSIQ